jgi:purine-nucleoside phosphorylase
MSGADLPDTLYDRIEEAARVVRSGRGQRPAVALVLGSGLGGLAREVEDATAIPYAAIPHMPVPSAPGHAGALVLGRLGGLPVAVLSGRVHLYDGYDAHEVAFGVLLARRLGAETLLITNAAGGIDPALAPGTLMCIADHINLTGRSPLTGLNDARLGPRFPDMSEAYDAELRTLAARGADAEGTVLAEGVYLGLAGPQFETPAEIGMARALGADAVGMSTVLEVIAAVHCGLRVLGISCITNAAAGVSADRLSERDVFETAARAGPRFTGLVRRILAGYGAAS